MKGPYYSVGPIKNIVLSASAISDCINDFKNTLFSCNWTLVSTSVVNGQVSYILKSYPTPVNHNCFQVRIFYSSDSITGASNINFYISDENGSNEQQCGYITINSNKFLRLLAGPHQFFIFLDLALYPIPDFFSHNNVMAGCPHVVNSNHSQVFWGQGDIGTFVFSGSTFRDSLAGANFSSFLINGFTPWRTSFPDSFSNTANCYPNLLSQRSIDLHEPVLFSNNSAALIEPLLTFGRVPNNYYSVALWDAIVVSKPFSTRLITEIDNRLWESITITSDPEVVGCLFLVTEKLQNRSTGSYSH